MPIEGLYKCRVFRPSSRRDVQTLWICRERSRAMQTAKGTTVIQNGQLVDGTGRQPIPNATVILRDGVIEYAGPSHGTPHFPPDAQQIDGRGGTIMPGLVETHYHPTYFNLA